LGKIGITETKEKHPKKSEQRPLPGAEGSEEAGGFQKLGEGSSQGRRGGENCQEWHESGK